MCEISLSETIKEIQIALKFNSESSAKSGFDSAIKALEQKGANILCLEVFAGKYAESAVDAFKAAFADYDFPLNWIYPLDEVSTPILGGAHITALVGAKPEVFKSEQGSIAVKYSDSYADYCRTFGVSTPKYPSDFEAHTYENICEIERTLQAAGFSYNNIVRTWFYNEDILSWYGDFNKARTRFYCARNVFEQLLPASTGIGAPNICGTKITSGAVAVRKKNFDVVLAEVPSPLQCGAPQYGSSFSRAVEIDTPYSKRIMVSGTASIEPGGKTVFQDDIVKQIDLTMRVIEEILKVRNMTFADTSRAVIYCLKPEYYENFLDWQKQNGIEIPHCPAYSIVCRDDLLFEVELEAIKNKGV